MVTVAFGIAAPVESNTVPPIAPWVDDCAIIAVVAMHRTAIQSAVILIFFIIIVNIWSPGVSKNFVYLRRCPGALESAPAGHGIYPSHTSVRSEERRVGK